MLLQGKGQKNKIKNGISSKTGFRSVSPYFKALFIFHMIKIHMRKSRGGPFEMLLVLGNLKRCGLLLNNSVIKVCVGHFLFFDRNKVVMHLH